MKESWLEKLIELLLNYEEEIKKSEWDYRYYWNMIDSLQLECRNVISSQILMREERWLILISKSYGFIQRLVENDKIDIDKLEKKVLKENLIRKFDEWLLMLLAIQDEPIRFLCEIIK